MLLGCLVSQRDWSGGPLVKTRLAIRIVVVSLALLVGVVPCAPMTLGAQAEEAHECCDDARSHARHHTAPCDLLCVSTASPATLSQQPAVQHYQPVSSAYPSAVVDPSAGHGRGVSLPAPAHWPDRSPPLYVRHQTFLI